MDTSLDKFYAKVCKNNRKIPEDILGKISLAVVSALDYLHTKLKVIHRDVKPSNILINRQGQVKMCDFGISGYLVDSVAKTIDAGCKPYMAVRTKIGLIYEFLYFLNNYLYFSRKESIHRAIHHNTIYDPTFGALAYHL